MFKLKRWMDNIASRDFKNNTNDNWNVIENALNFIKNFTSSTEKTVNERIDNLVINSGSDSSAEVIDSRIDTKGNQHDLIGNRLKSDFKSVDEELQLRGVNIKSYGAVGDGIADDTLAVVQARDEANRIGAGIFVPDGVFKVAQDFEWQRFFGSGTLLSNGKEVRFNALPAALNDKKFQKANAFNKNTYGTYNNATVGAFIANMNSEAQILGIPEDSSFLAIYDNRDSAAIFASNSTANNHYDFEYKITYGVDYVKVPELENEEVEIGMIIDTLHSPKYSGIVKKVDYAQKTIYVWAWYKMQNTSSGQIPPNTAGIRINPTTKIWGANINIHLEGEHPNTAGTALEIGLFNNQQHRDNVDGVDMINAGQVDANAAYRARTLNNTYFRYGLLAENCEYGLYADTGSVGVNVKNQKFVGYSSENNPVSYQSTGAESDKLLMGNVSGKLFFILNNGNMNNFGITRQIYSSGQEINIRSTSMAYLTGGTYSIAHPSNGPEKFMMLFNNTTTNSTITGNFRISGNAKNSITLKPFKALLLVSDGSEWHSLDTNDVFTE
ncbi:glycosyl hydrolase family 28-related protein [Bacillus cereus group sp. TH204-1LC]|uniref:glycosyl hydrolase family 28-related protein n=1 Tax=unclassified Bacillus cereus group TaxID=2750818 RepID=UPI0022E2E3FC|nr:MULTISPECIES: glycosyl hydrolase family 28-related protein [unclassified Bacillus cereus group]MDA1620146.1 glycosyl hydrolase family 28-related protein [Bacillus cereus group sp. TH204-1LC]MDX5886636.1 glycosyl hydrolase family 28-related protein [Bacillus cereus group sp. BfR-BA-00999]